MEKKGSLALTGALTGFINGFFGTGGGTVAVPALKRSGFETKKAHASSLAVTFPLSVMSAVMYSGENDIISVRALELIPFGLAGAAVGALLLRKISSWRLSVLFGLILIIASGRSILSWVF